MKLYTTKAPPFSQSGRRRQSQAGRQASSQPAAGTRFDTTQCAIQRKEKILSVQFNCVCSLPSPSPSSSSPPTQRALIQPNEAYSSNDQTTTAITNNCRLEKEQLRMNRMNEWNARASVRYACLPAFEPAKSFCRKLKN